MPTGLRFNTHKVLAGESFNIVASMNVQAVTYWLSSGASDNATITGGLTLQDGTGANMAPQALPVGSGATVISGSPAQPIDGVVFVVGTGTLYLIMAV